MDVIRFLQDHRIPYRTDGPNAKRGNVVLQCPFCGDDDPSEHMGWQLATGYWGCWRRKAHRGRRPHRLIMRLIGCSFVQADEIAHGGGEIGELDTILSKLSAAEEVEEERVLVMPDSFRELSRKGLGVHYVKYLRGRGFHRDSILDLTSDYGIRYCPTGAWRGRVIFPLYLDGRLVGWTGRTISSREERRYLSLSYREPDREGSQALMNIKDLVWNYDELVADDYDTLAIVEGPLDALKVDCYARSYAVRATCLFGTGVSEEQSALLWQLRGNFKKFVILGDKGAWWNVLEVFSALKFLRPKSASLPAGVEDPGALSRHQVRVLAKSLREW